jgi:4-hydroxy-tetrahydrodipicolinate synthase
MSEHPIPRFGRLATAMVTPYDDDLRVDLVSAKRLAKYLVDEMHNDTIIVNGTTGEAPTTYHDEKFALIEAVKVEVGNRAKVVTGVGTNDTNHTVGLAKEAKAAGADGLLVVTPYYSLPPQDGIIGHFLSVADATDLGVIIYDIPHRVGRPVEQKSLIKLAEHPNIVAVKDAKKDLPSSAAVIAATGLDYYAGDDALLLPILSIGGVGVVGTSTHFTGAVTAQIITDWLAGDTDAALAGFQKALPVYTGVFATQGCMLVKAGLEHLGLLPNRLVRQPLPPASDDEKAAFARLLDAFRA